MERILEGIKAFRTTLRALYRQDQQYYFDFDITMTERRRVFDRLEAKIEVLKKEELWKTDEKRRNAIEESYEYARTTLVHPNDRFFLRAITALSNNVKHFVNRTKNKETLLFATAIPEMSESLKTFIHDYDFLDQEVLYPQVLLPFLEEKKPNVVVVVEALEYPIDSLVELCATHVAQRFILIGDAYLENEVLQNLPHVTLWGGKISIEALENRLK